MRPNSTFILAVAASLGLHVVSFEVYWTYRVVAQILAPAAPGPRHEMIVSVDLKDLDSPDEMGEKSGTGIGSNQSAGDRPLEAPEADADQALLSRDPVGVGRTAGERTRWAGPQGEGGHGGVPAAEATPVPPIATPPAVVPSPPAKIVEKLETPPFRHVAAVQPTASMPAPSAAAAVSEIEPQIKPPTPGDSATAVALARVPESPVPEVDSIPSIGKSADGPKASAARPPAGQSADAHATAAQAAPAQASPAQPNPAQSSSMRPTAAPSTPAPPRPASPESGDGRRPGQPHPPAMALPPSDSDSDPFARIDSATFRDGRLIVRPGRKVKTKAPQILIAGQVDLLAITDPRVVLQIHIAPDGHVSDVSVARSSGSNQIDEPTRLAVYDWWFEPRKNSAGKPVPDVIFFEVAYR